MGWGYELRTLSNLQIGVIMVEALEIIIGGVVCLFAIMFIVVGIGKIVIPINENDAQNGVLSIILGIVIAVPNYMYFLN